MNKSIKNILLFPFNSSGNHHRAQSIGPALQWPRLESCGRNCIKLMAHLRLETIQHRVTWQKIIKLKHVTNLVKCFPNISRHAYRGQVLTVHERNLKIKEPGKSLIRVTVTLIIPVDEKGCMRRGNELLLS